jgi:quinol monooxygenase YgiN
MAFGALLSCRSMSIRRREVLAAIAASPLMVGISSARSLEEARSMFGLIGKIRATPGARAQLAALLIKASASMPGCRSYVVAADAAEADALWVTEVWDSAEAHEASLQLPQVRAAMAAGRPLIAGFAERAQTTPLGGTGIEAG